MRKLNMPRRLSSSAARTHGGNMLFMLPTIILFCIVVLIPFFQGIPYSFTNWKSIVSETKEFNGLKNYIYLIKNKYFQDSLLVTFKFTILYMISANVMGLLLALAIHRSSWFNNIARTVLFLPFTVSATAGSIVWSYVFTDVYGTITGLVSPLGMPGQIIYGMVVIGAWRDMGYTMLIYIAALQAVPQDYYEAATVDGANRWQKLVHITVPCIRSIIIVILITRIGSLMQAGFEQIFVLYHPGVYGTADIIDTYVYRMGLQDGKFELATAVGLFKSVINFGLVVAANKIARMSGEEGIY